MSSGQSGVKVAVMACNTPQANAKKKPKHGNPSPKPSEYEAMRVEMVGKFDDLYRKYGHIPASMRALAKWARRMNMPHLAAKAEAKADVVPAQIDLAPRQKFRPLDFDALAVYLHEPRNSDDVARFLDRQRTGAHSALVRIQKEHGYCVKKELVDGRMVYQVV